MSQTRTNGHHPGAERQATIQSDNGVQPGRDGRGRFAAGNTFGLGSSHARRAGRLRQAIQDEVSDDDLRRVARALVDKAAQGDVAAARVLLAYAVGKPQPASDPDRAIGDEAQTLADQASAGLNLARVAPEVAHEALSATIPNYGYRPADVPDPDTADDEDDEAEAEAPAPPPDLVAALTEGLATLPVAERRRLARLARDIGRTDTAAPSDPPS